MLIPDKIQRDGQISYVPNKVEIGDREIGDRYPDGSKRSF
jgi:hypothetical protein